FRRKSVRVLSSGPDEAEATVTGSEPYHVGLVREDKKLLGSCSCPYFTDRGEICKHVWAALLAVDELGALRGTGDDLPLRLVAEGATEKSPTWRDVLGRLPPEEAPASDPADEILYVIDAQASWKSQRLVLDIMTGRRQSDGSLGPLHLLRMQKTEISNLEEPADREILAVAAGPVPAGGWGAYSYRGAEVPSHIELAGPAASLLLPSLCRTGRFRLRRNRGTEASDLLTWDDGPAWEIWLDVREEEDGSCTLTGSLRRGEERLAFSEPSLLLCSGHLFQVGQVSRLDLAGFAWIPLLARAGWSLRVPAGEKEDLLERLLSSPALPRLDLPESLRFEKVRVPPRPRLRLRSSHRGASRGSLSADLSFQYGDRERAALSGGSGLYQRGERRFLLRDPKTEQASIDRLQHLGFRLAPSNPRQLSLSVSPARVPSAVRALLAEGWMVEAEGKLYRSANTLRVAVSSGIDWFEMRGQAEFEGESVGLPDLLAALRKGDGFVTLDDGSLGLIPEEWLKRLGPIAALGQAEGDHLEFKPTQVALLDAWLESEPAATCDEAFDRARRRLRSFEGVSPAEAPPGFQGELRGYQRAGLGWLHFLRDFGFGGCLADDMGLGKTVQVLALLESRRGGELPSLVVVPKSLIFNWRAEAERFTPNLRVLDHTGTGRTRKGEPFTGDVVLTTYGTLRRDIGALRQVEFDYVILDEAQAIKNADSQTAKAARLLRGRHRLALTGTPVENHLGELWSLLEFLNPGLLGASPLLRSRSEELRNPGSETRLLLARALRPFLLRRTKEQVAPELPARVEQTLVCELPPHQRRLYNELRDHYRSALGGKIGEQGLGRSKILVLEALLRLRQAACHPGLLDPKREDEPSAKLDLLLPQLQEILDEGHKALVFSQFTTFLALLRRQLDREGIPYLYLDGKTRDRQEKVERFQSDPDFPLFLISLKAGGLGLNLTAADYVYLLDPWWNPAVEAQAIDRAHRIGQTRPVFASRIVAKDTVEEKILELQKSKRELADAIIQADKSLLAALSREDLELLLS
ncbi:MAG TPA: SNF2-related protein, partial [Thermoanaerobaculia bacterium]|nr:SNF2-related protein [Thermoanaerobaculia bacterium]